LEFNAEQRVKAFNFFVVFFGFASGGIFAAIGKDSHPVVFLLLGFFVCLLPVLFCVIDARSRNLLEMTKPGLIKYEEALAWLGIAKSISPTIGSRTRQVCEERPT
jgi:Na+-driven multidrug efflux pump